MSPNENQVVKAHCWNSWMNRMKEWKKVHLSFGINSCKTASFGNFQSLSWHVRRFLLSVGVMVKFLWFYISIVSQLEKVGPAAIFDEFESTWSLLSSKNFRKTLFCCTLSIFSWIFGSRPPCRKKPNRMFARVGRWEGIVVSAKNSILKRDISI